MDKKIIYILIVILVALLIALGVFLATSNGDGGNDVNTLGDNGQSEVEKVTVRVNEVTRSVFYAPQYVAISKGFFEAEGIEVDITTGQGADKVMTAVLAGQSDIGFAGPEASIYVYNEGKADYTEVFAQLTKTDGSFLVSKTDIKDFKWTDLKGKTIIPGRKGGVPYMALEYVIKQNGMDPSNEMILDDSIKFDLMAGAFTGGTADFVTLFEPTASMTEDAGKGYIVASVGEALGEMPYTAYFAKKSYIEENSDLIERFTRAIYKAQQWVQTHTPTEIAEAIVDFFPDTSVELLATNVQRYMDIDAWNATPVMTKESFELLQTVMESAGELDTRAPFEKVVNNSFAEKVSK